VPNWTVITLDLRGHSESDSLTDPATYIPSKLGDDILAVADACGVADFAIWGMSYGGKVSRYLAVASERVTKLVVMGTPMGPAVSGQRRQDALDFCVHWPPIVKGIDQGTLNLNSISPTDRDFWKNFDVPAMLGWVKAMLDWPTVEPADFRCPTRWLVGSEDRNAGASLAEYERSLPGSLVDVHILQDLDHEQVFSEIGTALPIMLAFTES
jgi:pimeloyl-ACP methyl ester carboxylesterase